MGVTLLLQGHLALVVLTHITSFDFLLRQRIMTKLPLTPRTQNMLTVIVTRYRGSLGLLRTDGSCCKTRTGALWATMGGESVASALCRDLLLP